MIPKFLMDKVLFPLMGAVALLAGLFIYGRSKKKEGKAEAKADAAEGVLKSGLETERNRSDDDLKKRGSAKFDRSRRKE